MTYAMMPMGMAATPGNHVLRSFQMASQHYPGNETMQVRRDLLQSKAL